MVGVQARAVGNLRGHLGSDIIISVQPVGDRVIVAGEDEPAGEQQQASVEGAQIGQRRLLASGEAQVVEPPACLLFLVGARGGVHAQ